MTSLKALRILSLLACLAVCAGLLAAQSQRSITIRMLDGKTGHLIKASNYLVRIDRQSAVHANWVTQAEDAPGKLTLPPEAKLVLIQGTYESAMQLYVNCDAAGEKGTPPEHWYEIVQILSTGLTARNGCAKPREAAKIQVAAKPGEFIFYVRRMNPWEEAKDDFAAH
jgi:hypothetical protein